MTGLYFYDEWAPEYAAALKPSACGELKVTELNLECLKRGALHVEQMGGALPGSTQERLIRSWRPRSSFVFW